MAIGVFHWSHDPRDQWPEGHAYADWLGAQGEELAAFNQRPDQVPPELHLTSWCTDRALDFINEKRQGPWLMSVNVFDPHSPFDPPQAYLDRYRPERIPDPLWRDSDREAHQRLGPVDGGGEIDFEGAKRIQAAYYGMIELIDDNVGRMLDGLEASGQRKNTIVIFMSDHGELLGDHGLVGKGCRFYEWFGTGAPDRILAGAI